MNDEANDRGDGGNNSWSLQSVKPLGGWAYTTGKQNKKDKQGEMAQ